MIGQAIATNNQYIFNRKKVDRLDLIVHPIAICLLMIQTVCIESIAHIILVCLFAVLKINAPMIFSLDFSIT